MISVCREHCAKSSDGAKDMLRLCAAWMVKAGKQFRCINGQLHVPTLRAALDRRTAQHVVPVVQNDQVSAA